MRTLKELLKPGEVIVIFTTTDGFHNYHCIMKRGGEDKISALNHTLETMLNAGYGPFEIKSILGAALGEAKGSVGIFLDRGYVIPGEIFTWNQTVVTYESVAKEKSLYFASTGDRRAILFAFSEGHAKTILEQKTKAKDWEVRPYLPSDEPIIF